MERKIKQARSQHNGILFYSSLFPFLGIKSIITDKNEYIAGPTITLVDDVIDFWGSKTLEKYVLKRGTIYLINSILFFIAIVFYIHTRDFRVVFVTLYFIYFASKHLYQLILFSIGIKMGEAKRLGRFHSAEHMAVDAYNSLNRVPTLTELQKFSRYSPDCGSMKLIANATIFTVISIEMFLFLGSSFGVFLICFTSFIYALNYKFKYLRFVQVLLTNKPTEIELNVALNGLKEFEKIENAIKSDCLDSVSFFPDDPEIEVEFFEK